MSIADRLVALLGRGRPDEAPAGRVIEIAWVELWQSELIVSGLAAAGIRAAAVPESFGARPIGPRLQQMARIMVSDHDRLRARTIVDELTGPNEPIVDEADER